MLSDSHMSVVKMVPKSCESGSSGIINFFPDSKLFVSDPAKMKEQFFWTEGSAKLSFCEALEAQKSRCIVLFDVDFVHFTNMI